MMVIFGGARRWMGVLLVLSQPSEQIEGEDLALISVDGKLEVKMAETFRGNIRPIWDRGN